MVYQEEHLGLVELLTRTVATVNTLKALRVADGSQGRQFVHMCLVGDFNIEATYKKRPSGLEKFLLDYLRGGGCSTKKAKRRKT